MRVVFLEDVAGVANGGEVKEVKNGFARNYLIPKNLAVPASHNALQRVERLKKEADTTRVKLLTDMSALAEELNGVQVQVEMRAGTGGRLYGSVTNAIVAEQLQDVIGREIDRRLIEIPDPIRELGTFDVSVRLHPEVQAAISVLVYASGTDPTMLDEQKRMRSKTARVETMSLRTPFRQWKTLSCQSKRMPRPPNTSRHRLTKRPAPQQRTQPMRRRGRPTITWTKRPDHRWTNGPAGVLSYEFVDRKIRGNPDSRHRTAGRSPMTSSC